MKILPLMPLLSLRSFLFMLQQGDDLTRSRRWFYSHLLLLLGCTYISRLYTPISELSHFSNQANHVLSEP